MNRRSSGSLFLSKAIGGFIQYKAAEGLSPTTLNSYEGHLKLWLEYTGDIPVKQIDAKVIQGYFVSLRTEYQPRQVAGHSANTLTEIVLKVQSLRRRSFRWDDRASASGNQREPSVMDSPHPVNVLRKDKDGDNN